MVIDMCNMKTMKWNILLPIEIYQGSEMIILAKGTSLKEALVADLSKTNQVLLLQQVQ